MRHVTMLLLLFPAMVTSAISSGFSTSELPYGSDTVSIDQILLRGIHIIFRPQEANGKGNMRTTVIV